MHARNLENVPFWQKPMRVIDWALEDPHGSWHHRWTAEQLVQIAVRMNANVLNMMVVNEWGLAYWPSPHLPVQPEITGEDRFGQVAELARQAGLHVCGMWGPSGSPTQVQRHPDWAWRSRDGKKQGWGVLADEMTFYACMNSPFEDLVNQVLDQLFKDYPIEMIALDLYLRIPCWCEYCRERCLADTGFDIFAERVPFGRENIHEQWQEKRVHEQIARIKQTIGRYGGALVTGKAADGTDVLFAEPHTGDMLDLRDKGFMIRQDYGRSRALDKGVVTCSPYAHHYLIGWSKPPAHMRQEYRTISIHGSNPWPVMWDWEVLRDQRGLEPLGAVFGEMQSLEALMVQARPLRHVALVYGDNVESEKQIHPHEHGDAVKGFYDSLSRAHVPFEMIPKEMISADGLQGFEALVLPNVAALSDDQIAAVTQFVADGGGLVSTYETSMYTSQGWDRYDFGLKEVFGVRYLAHDEAPWCYVKPTGPHPVFDHMEEDLGIPHGDLWRLVERFQNAPSTIPCEIPGLVQSFGREPQTTGARNAGTHLKVEAAEKAEVIAHMFETQKPRGSYFLKDMVPAIPGNDTGYASVVVNRFGDGISIYFAGQPDRLYHRQGHPDYEKLLGNAVTWVSPRPQLHVVGPNTVETTYWELASGGYLVHLLNHSYDALFPAPSSCYKVPASREVFRAITEVIPVHNVKLVLQASPNSVNVLVGTAEVIAEGREVILPELGEYAAIHIE